MVSSERMVEKLVVLLEKALVRDEGLVLRTRHGKGIALIVQEWAPGGYPWRLYSWDDYEDVRDELLKEGSLLEVCEEADTRGFIKL